MIVIAIDSLVLPAGWVDSRNAVRQKLEDAAGSTARSLILDSSEASDVWKALRANMALLSSDKCWYCETVIARDDFYVDHYRPKGAVLEDLPHGGYWWLALEEENFRLACKYCNERRVDPIGGTAGGKRAHFPLLAGSVRATADSDSTDLEKPVLIDPVKFGDVKLLNFGFDGRACHRPGVTKGTTEWNRVTESIDILHLNHGRLTKLRRQCYKQVSELVQRVDAAYVVLRQARSTDCPQDVVAALQWSLDEAIELVFKRTLMGAPFVGTAKAVLRSKATPDRQWITEVLEAA